MLVIAELFFIAVALIGLAVGASMFVGRLASLKLGDNSDQRPKPADVSTLDVGPKAEENSRPGGTTKLASAPLQGCRLYRERREAALILEAAYGIPRSVGLAAGQVVELANRDFVQSWYKNTSPDLEFLEDTRLIMLDIVGGFVSRLCNLNFSAFLVKDVAPILRRNVVRFQEARQKAASLNPAVFQISESDTASHYARREECLVAAGLFIHEGAKDGGRHIQSIAGKVLQVLLPPQERQCSALVHLIREIIVRSIVFPILDSLHPYCLNAALVNTSKGAEANKQQDDGRAINTLKVAAESFMTNPDESSLDEEPAVVASTSDPARVGGGGGDIEDRYFTMEASHLGPESASKRGSPLLSPVVITAARISRPELALDYSDAQDPSPYMAYILEIKGTSAEGEQLSWTEKTRYSKLKRLNEVLTIKHPSMSARFPSSRGWKKYLLGLPEYDKGFVESRVSELNEYFDGLMNDPSLRDSPVVRKFLCGPGFKARQSEASKAPYQEKPVDEFANDVSAFRSAKLTSSDLREVYLLVEQIFLLDQGSFSFFRANIISFVRIILKTAFKGSVFKHLSGLSDHQVQTVADALVAVREGTWPNGKLAPPPNLPPEDDQNRVRNGALAFLRTALPQQVVSLIGDKHRDLVASNAHELLQYHTLTKSICIEVADALIRKLFPDA